MNAGSTLGRLKYYQTINTEEELPQANHSYKTFKRGVHAVIAMQRLTSASQKPVTKLPPKIELADLSKKSQVAPRVRKLASRNADLIKLPSKDSASKKKRTNKSAPRPTLQPKSMHTPKKAQPSIKLVPSDKKLTTDQPQQQDDVMFVGEQ